jgi:coproporphyrinogen III oxidase-like Fe-S oxidoreductase
MMDPARADAARNVFSAYVHIPFCSAVCPYCDFAVVAGRDDLVDRYARSVIAEVRMSETRTPLGSAYFGGGTPTHVAPNVLGGILETLAEHHGLRSDAEVSVEANPEDFSRERADELRGIGFNRVSFGARASMATCWQLSGVGMVPRRSAGRCPWRGTPDSRMCRSI